MTAEVSVVILNRYGLHIRPSTQFMTLANQFRSDIRVETGQGLLADGKSIMDLLALSAESGETLRITAEGDDAAQAVESLGELVKGQFGGIDDPASSPSAG